MSVSSSMENTTESPNPNALAIKKVKDTAALVEILSITHTHQNNTAGVSENTISKNTIRVCRFLSLRQRTRNT